MQLCELWQTACLVLLISIVTVLINKEIDAPYMDEVFHVRQTQKYCDGKFKEWDPKITTFPGLYVISSVLGHFVGSCELSVLRSINMFFLTACIPVFYRLSKLLDHKNPWSMAMACTLFPLHFFYSSLFYTDTASVFFTFGALLFGLLNNRFLRFLFSVAAVSVRQTNIVWVAYIAGFCLLKQQQPKSFSQGRLLLNMVRSAPSAAWEILLLLVLFAFFLIKNGSVVIGDKQHHAPILHWVQPLYFVGYMSIAFAPVCWTLRALRFSLESVSKHPFRVCIVGLIMCFLISNFTYVHPFILADNRHYVFYIWRRIVNYRPWSRYALVAIYLHAGRCMHAALRENSAVSLLLYTGGTVLVLVPAHLLELRYFSTPALLLVLLGRWDKLSAITVFWLCINIATMWVFIYRPYEWVDGSVARFLY